jgi:hypothetical protein
MLLGEQAIERFFFFSFFSLLFPMSDIQFPNKKYLRAGFFPQGRNLELDVGDP